MAVQQWLPNGLHYGCQNGLHNVIHNSLHSGCENDLKNDSIPFSLNNGCPTIDYTMVYTMALTMAYIMAYTMKHAIAYTQQPQQGMSCKLAKYITQGKMGHCKANYTLSVQGSMGQLLPFFPKILNFSKTPEPIKISLKPYNITYFEYRLIDTGASCRIPYHMKKVVFSMFIEVAIIAPWVGQLSPPRHFFCTSLNFDCRVLAFQNFPQAR